ncbi:unnamed protein product, partial [Mesorhabditis belari]|uniref:G-protein coupled receptors family 1 profile domain-containing protein n=1 Tax=Mesorhabditis belari TaxID=2138241 RepID=A0AAF3FKM6_9BILA
MEIVGNDWESIRNTTFESIHGYLEEHSSLTSPSTTMEKEECFVFYEKSPDLSNTIFAMVFFASVYVTIFVLGIAGNFSIIFVTLKYKNLQTVQNMFILNLAASDIMICLLSLPITPVTNIYKNWYFGAMMCRLIPWVQGVSIFICTFSLGAIAVDRYILVVRPHSPPITKRGALILTAILWSVSIVVTFPYAYYMTEESYEDENICGKFCTEKWPNAFTRRAYTLVVMIAQFVLPFLLMAFCYTSIFARLKTRTKVRLRKMDARSTALEASTINHDHEKQPDQKFFLDQQGKDRQRLLDQTRRTTNILVAMVVMFGMTWLPHNVISLVIEYDDNQSFFHLFGREDLDFSYLLNLFTHSFAMTNNVTNPVLYAWLNPKFREYVIRTFIGRSRDGSSRVISQPTTKSFVSNGNGNVAMAAAPRKRISTFTGFAAKNSVLKKLKREKRRSMPENGHKPILNSTPIPYEVVEPSEHDAFV